jgi:hypothetical protein
VGTIRPRFEPITDAERDNLQRQSDTAYAKLTDGERKALDEYTKKMFEHINGYLNTGSFTDPKIPDYVKNIDSAMAKFELEDSITVFKGTKAAWYDGWEMGRAEPINLYLSTSVSKDVAQKYCDKVRRYSDDPIMLEINVPKGTRGIYIGSNTKARENELEFLIWHGLKYRVIERDGNTLRMEAVYE